MEASIETFWKHFEAFDTPSYSEAALLRSAEALWRLCTVLDTSVMPSIPLSGSVPKTIEIGRNMLTDSEKWSLQAKVRREQTTIGGKEYNKKVTRATKQTKGPTPGEGFPAGRGRPLAV
jgi:hypothetical protein